MLFPLISTEKVHNISVLDSILHACICCLLPEFDHLQDFLYSSYVHVVMKTYLHPELLPYMESNCLDLAAMYFTSIKTSRQTCSMLSFILTLNNTNNIVDE